MRDLYRADLFLTKSEAVEVNNAGRHFLMGYGRLAVLTHESRECLFAHIPKV